MRKLLIAGVAAVAIAMPVTAHASDASYKAGCGFNVLNDPTPDGQLGGPEEWAGVVHATVVATSPVPARVSIECHLRINGSDNGSVLTAATPGVQIAAGAGTVSFRARSTDVIEFCDHVIINGVLQQPVECVWA